MADPDTQDGHKVCKPNCAYDMRTPARDAEDARAEGEATDLSAATTLKNAERLAAGNLYSLMEGVSACTRIVSGSTVYPAEIVLSAGGSSVPFVMTGITFTSADALTASNSGITFGTASISSDQTTWTTTVAASGLVPRGEYDFLFNGARFPKTFRVR